MCTTCNLMRAYSKIKEIPNHFPCLDTLIQTRGMFEKNTIMLWCYSVMVLWCYGVMVLWCYGVMVLWCYGVIVL